MCVIIHLPSYPNFNLITTPAFFCRVRWNLRSSRPRPLQCLAQAEEKSSREVRRSLHLERNQSFEKQRGHQRLQDRRCSRKWKLWGRELFGKKFNLGQPQLRTS